MRAALAAAGARLLEAVLAGDDDGYAGPHAKCGAGHQAVYAGSRPKTVTTVLGPVQAAPGLVSLPRRANAASRRAMSSWAWPGRRCRRAWRDDRPGRRGGPLRQGRRAACGPGRGHPQRQDRRAVRRGLRRRRPRRPEPPRQPRSAPGAIVPLPPPEPVPDMLYAEVDGTGVPVRASETEGRPGKGERRAGRDQGGQARPAVHRVPA